MNAPCYNCPYRTRDCHGKCRDYLDWKRATSKDNSVRRSVDSAYYEIIANKDKHWKGDKR